jgi:hypothetical protein
MTCGRAMVRAGGGVASRSPAMACSSSLSVVARTWLAMPQTATATSTAEVKRIVALSCRCAVRLRRKYNFRDLKTKEVCRMSR